MSWKKNDTVKRKLLIGLNLMLVLLAACASRVSEHPLASRSQANIELESHSLAFDDPGAAYAYLSLRNSDQDGQAVDLVDRYEKGRRQMERMRRFSTRANRFVSDDGRSRPFSDMPLGRDAAVLDRWESLGPGNIGGRTRALLIHPSQPEIMYAAGVSGGVWKTLDGGQSWKPLSDFLPNIAVSTMVFDSSNPEILYAGTGEGHFREVVRGTALPLRGAGIFQSRNGGATWVRLASTNNEDFYWVNELLVSHLQPSRLYAATRSGVFRSVDCGQSWQRTLDPTVNGGCFHLALRTDADRDSILASCGTFAQATVYQNIAAEESSAWEPVLTEPGMGLTSLAVAPSNQNRVYALSASIVGGPGNRFNGGLHAVFRSDEGGRADSWRVVVRNTDPRKVNTLLLTNPIVASSSVCESGVDVYSTLGWYTNMITVDPLNPDVVFAGGIDLFRSDDGGESWGPISYWWLNPPSAHADQHVLRFHPSYDGEQNRRVFLAGDGGIYRSDNPRAERSTALNSVCDIANSQVQWTALNNNYGVTQFYHGTPFPDGRRYLGGAQDNGTILGLDASGSNAWNRILGGDGAYSAIDPTDTNVIYASSQQGAFAKSTDGGQSFFSARQGIQSQPGEFLFIAPFLMDPQQSQRLWLGGRSMWRTDNRASVWQRASAELAGGGRVSAIAVSPLDSNRVLAGLENGFIARTDRGLTSTSFISWETALPRAGFVSSLAVDPADQQIIYATYAGFGGQHVWKSSDQGVSWTSTDGSGDSGLPDIPVHSVVIDPRNTQRLYLGTDLGVFVSLNGGAEWAVENTGFANVVTEWLTIAEPEGEEPKLFAFTHGRGAWRVALTDSGRPVPCQPDRWLAHITPLDVSFTTRLLLNNTSESVQEVTLVPFGGEGEVLPEVVVRLEGGRIADRLSSEIFPNLPVSHVGICGPSAIKVTAAIKEDGPTGATAHINETSRTGNVHLFYPAERQLVFEGMAIVNVGTEATDLTLRLVTGDQQEILSRRIATDLVPRAKFIDVLPADFQDAGGAAIRIESSQPLVVLLLRGTRPNLGPIVLFQTATVVR